MVKDVVHDCKVMLNSKARFIGERSKPSVRSCESRFAVYMYRLHHVETNSRVM